MVEKADRQGDSHVDEKSVGCAVKIHRQRAAVVQDAVLVQEVMGDRDEDAGQHAAKCSRAADPPRCDAKHEGPERRAHEDRRQQRPVVEDVGKPPRRIGSGD